MAGILVPPFKKNSNTIFPRSASVTAFGFGTSNTTVSHTISGASISHRISIHADKAGTDIEDLVLWNGSTNAAQAPRLAFVRNKNTIASPTVVASGDELGMISFQGYDGTDYEMAAVITGEVDGTPGSNDMPGRLVFSVTPDGSATPAEALRIQNDKSSVFSGVVAGGTSTSSNLTLSGTTQTYDSDTISSLILFKTPMDFDSDWTITTSPTVSQYINTSGIITGSGAIASFAGFRHSITFQYTTNQVLSQFPAFQATATCQPTFSNTDVLNYYVGFSAINTYKLDTAATTSSTYAHMGYVSAPQIRFISGTSIAIDRIIHYGCYATPVFGGVDWNLSVTNLTVTNLIGLEFAYPQATNGFTITNVYGVRISDFTYFNKKFSQSDVVSTLTNCLYITSTARGGVNHRNLNLTEGTINTVVGGITGCKGGFTSTAVTTPSAPTITPVGTTGAATWSYRITAVTANGESLASTAGSTATGNANLSTTNYNRITITRVSGAAYYNIYRTAVGTSPATTGIIGTLDDNSNANSGGGTVICFLDTGLAGSGAAVPVFQTTNFIGLDTSAPTAALHIAGTTQGSHIRMAGIAGVPTTETPGDIWYDTTDKCLKFTQTDGVMGAVGTASVNTSDSSAIASTTAETNYSLNFAIPANALTVGKTYRVRAAMTYSNTLSPTLQIKFKLGSTTVVDLGAVSSGTSVTNRSIISEFVFTCRSTGATGTIFAHGKMDIENASSIVGSQSTVLVTNTATTTINTTASQTVQISAQWSASSASNTTTMRNFMVEVLC